MRTMCKPTATGPKEVCIVGAGPAGLLAAIFLLRRNDVPDGPRYRVTLVDPGADYGLLDADGLARARSWMIGLSCHGLSAIREIPGLYENYVQGLGIDLERVVMGISRSIKLEFDARDVLPKDSAFTVDRNFICAALSRYLNDKYGDSDAFVSRYYTRALYVDGENKRLICRATKAAQGGSTAPLDDVGVDYDVLLGCDGIRSVVRNAFLTTHRDFEFDLRGTFGRGKSVHVNLPPDVKKPGTFMLIINSLPDFVSFILPETGRKLNVNFGISDNKEVPQELLSDDPNVVTAYVREHFSAFDIDADEVGRQWVGQGWNTIAQVHCNFYHSAELSALLLGDAAHATSPNIGQGMNTALADAAALDALLDEHKDDWTAVLPRFSELRVKEGNALTDLSYYTFSLSPSQQMSLMLRQNVRRTLNRYLPALVDPEPMSEIPKGMKLSEAYHRMAKLGIVSRVRAVNDGITRDHFERTTGMVREEKGGGMLKKMVMYGAVPIAAAVVIALARKA